VTEIPDLSAIFGQGPPQREPTGAEKAAAEAEHKRQHREQTAQVAMLAFWAPLLCSCVKWPEHGNTRPPQEDCMIHGHMMMNACTGIVYLPGMPPPEGGDEHQ
jgi:hypothetical protein